MPRRRTRFTSGQPPPLLPLVSSAGRHYRAARAPRAGARPRAARTHPLTPGPRPLRPPGVRVRSPGVRCLPGRAPAITLRRGSGSARRRASPGVCALQSGPMPPCRGGGGRGRSPSAAAGGASRDPRAARARAASRATLCPPSSDLPSGGLERAVRWGRMPGASSLSVAGLGGQCWEVGCTHVPSHRAVLAGATMAQAATRGWVRSSGRMPSPAPPARWYLP